MLGVGLIVHQAGFVPPAHFNLTLTLVGATLVGVPGASQLLALRFGTPPGVSPPQPEDSPASPPSSSPAA